MAASGTTAAEARVARHRKQTRERLKHLKKVIRNIMSNVCLDSVINFAYVMHAVSQLY